jgi:SpoIID/LytB domain protein
MNKSSKFLVTAAVVTGMLSGSMGAARAAEVVQVPAGFTITGSGFGHGVGMSQYGAQGMGLDGYTASQILTHYYQGTAVNSVPLPSTNIRVGILQDKKFVAIRGENVVGQTTGGAFSIVIDNAERIPAITIAPGAVATFTTDANGQTEVSSGGSILGAGAIVNVTWVNADTVMHVRSGADAATAVSELGSLPCAPNACTSRYRYGTLELTSGLYGDEIVDLVVVNTLRLSDEYLYGLGEVPSSWTEAAMQAQAIAGRSYAVMKTIPTKPRSGCNCQIYSTTLDQAFVGYSKEVAVMGDLWVAAVNATITDINTNTALVVQYNGATISTYYSSSTGGKSQPTSEVWGSAFPYLVTVDDRWSLDPRVRNGNTSWTATIDQATLVSRLRALGVNVADVWSMTVAGSYASGGISKINLSDSAGNITTLNIAPGQPVAPDGLRTLLGTKSTYISAITPGIETVPGSTSATAKKLKSVTKVNWPKKTIVPSDYNFSGRVSPAQLGATVKLQRKSGGKWQTISTATTNDKGAWSILWAGPTAGKHDLRITATNSKGTVKTKTKRVNMAGSIGVSAPKSAKRNSSVTVSGSVNPGYANVAVVVERKLGNGKWKRIGTVATDASGNWAITHNVSSKRQTVSYRAKTSDARLGVLVSKAKKTKVK